MSKLANLLSDNVFDGKNQHKNSITKLLENKDKTATNAAANKQKANETSIAVEPVLKSEWKKKQN